MTNFNDCVRDVCLVGHSHVGSLYTWSKNWKENGMCLINVPIPSDSDYCPLNVTLEEELIREPKPFKYQAFWANHEEYGSILEDVWNQKHDGNGMDVLYCKLKSMRSALRKLNAESFSHISSRVERRK
ncbi:hypothetical protein LIER_01512 [Lithospermum erythrorhizon]|uniref:Uncharacterized protein n=1 Tax=Lithospermum erythrorhizon TaxID=34254 RepID=A0AAV3NL63_LITER